MELGGQTEAREVIFFAIVLRSWDSLSLGSTEPSNVPVGSVTYSQLYFRKIFWQECEGKAEIIRNEGTRDQLG